MAGRSAAYPTMERAVKFSLEGFVTQHWNAFVSMQQCADHVEYQLPNEHTQVGYLLEGIVCPDASL